MNRGSRSWVAWAAGRRLQLAEGGADGGEAVLQSGPEVGERLAEQLATLVVPPTVRRELDGPVATGHPPQGEPSARELVDAGGSLAMSSGCRNGNTELAVPRAIRSVVAAR